jgi:F-type H+-transporting ATPase subunit gamma
MQMVAAAKLRRAQEAAEASRPYAARMTTVLSNIASGNRDNPEAPVLLRGTGSDQRHLLVVCTAERGLCGGFNSSIVRRSRIDIDRLVSEGKDVKVMCVGRKGREQLRRDYAHLFVDSITFEGIKRMSYAQAEQVADPVLTAFANGEYDVITLYYSEFKSVIAQEPQALQIIPATIGEAEGDEAGSNASYEYEPDENALLADLLPKNIKVQIYRALLENAASEQGARMSAMDNATRNAGEMVDKLTLQYNRSRQAAITSELIEIISGAEALND